MKTQTILFREKDLLKSRIVAFWVCLFFTNFFFIKVINAQSTKEFKVGTDTLVVYSAVPSLAPSDKFTIRVRSVATNNQWVDVFAHYTYNRALEIPDINMLSGNVGSNSSTSVQHYPNATAGWSQTYGNIEISRNQPVEVEIALKTGVKIDGKDIYKATVHPAHKASIATVINGKVYFIINNPVQVAIDINGQFDEHNPFSGTPIAPPSDGVSSYTVPLHSITLFTNPVLKKPSLNNPRTKYIEPGTDSTAMTIITNQANSSTYDTLYFKPGVHNIGREQKIYPGKVYYIPGDAIIYGSLNNDGALLPSGFKKIGEKITIFGYGTISGKNIKHPYYVANPGIHEPINIDQSLNYKVIGITIADGAHFSLWTPSGVGGLVSFVKVIGWRANGDGLGNGDNVNDCFVRTNDDASYVRGNRKRVTYWKDNISAIFYMAAIWTTPVLIEDCDVLYCRARGGGGAAWDMRADQTAGVKQTLTTFRNIRFHDPKSNMTIFNLVTYKGDVAAPSQIGQSYNWIKFENISIASSSVKSNLLGCAASPWNGGLTFDNVTYAGTLLTEGNFSTYFNTNSYVNSIIFKSRTSYTISATSGTGGTVQGGGSYAKDEAVTVIALPVDDKRFVNWTENGVEVSKDAYFTFVANNDRQLVANFSIITNVENLYNKNTVSIYPNPATSILNIDSEFDSERLIKIFNNTGQIVYSFKTSNANTQIYVESLNLKGVIIVQVITGNEVSTQKVIVK